MTLIQHNPRKLSTPIVTTNRQKHVEGAADCPRGPLPREATCVDYMYRKLKTEFGAAIYAWRKMIVKAVFGQIKEARGFRRFSILGPVRRKANVSWCASRTTF